jgi:methylenetetrahydrofolate reductase (NADPH)
MTADYVPGRTPLNKLTDRERQVLMLRAAGTAVDEIAATLVVEPRTVKYHLRNIYAKLGLHQRSQGARQLALLRYGQSLAKAVGAYNGMDSAPAPQDTRSSADVAISGNIGPAASPELLGRRFLFRPDRKITQVLARGGFTLSAEVMPPRNGAEQGTVLGQVAQLVLAGAQFLAVTKGAGGSLRGGSLPIAQAIKEQFGVPCIAHFTCRDLVPEEVENQLMDHHYFGIRNILALRGDPPDGQPEWQARPGGYSYAYELIEQIRHLNQGHYLTRRAGPIPEAQEPTDFCIGAAVYPEHPDPDEGIAFVKRKIDAGAEYAITQMVFDADEYGRLLDRCEKRGIDIPILPGTRILRSRAQARRTAEKFGVSVPHGMLRALPSLSDPDAQARALDLFFTLAERLRRLGAPGIHIFVTDTTAACEALAALASSGKSGY